MSDWTIRMSYAAATLTVQDVADLADRLTAATVRYDRNAAILTVRIQCQAESLDQALERTLPAAAAATGLLKPTALTIQLSADFRDGSQRTPVIDLVGLTEIAGMLKTSTQRASQLAKTHSQFPKPVGHPSGRPVYTRESIEAFEHAWNASPTRHGGRPRGRPPTAQ
ncbi:hypothetical protein QDT91_29085 (plasmid) [Mycolicibacterium aubagnense]|jgi:hypothetical protein|uniref:hypothetical protein n=1 Tax=Mycolicibacterium aubagnense TaxID=319707 RepID=UPI00244E0303|nr:hypothetical protein [Mycolicibacterium aubagnense]WGI36057.1 hypothetical protein QDT91_29085 [Mycolicibacterium aubagnense]